VKADMHANAGTTDLLMLSYRRYWQAVATSALVTEGLVKSRNIMVFDNPEICRNFGVSPPKTIELQDADFPGVMLLPLGQVYSPVNTCTYTLENRISWSMQGRTLGWEEMTPIMMQVFALHTTPYFIEYFQKEGMPVRSCQVIDSTTTTGNLVDSMVTLGQLLTVSIELNVNTNYMEGAWRHG
jgi:hypothetical protein